MALLLTLLGSLLVLTTGWATWRGGLAWAHLPTRRHAAGALVVALVVTGYAGWAGDHSTGAFPARDEPPATTVTARPGTALAVLATLAVKGRAPKTGYARDLFGPAWADTDHNGCDTRNDILGRDLTEKVVKPGTRGCKVLAGTAAPEVYTGTTIRFSLGGAPDIDIDHVVALADAWQKGAQQWPASTRVAFANDPMNLLAVAAAANRAKGAGDAATWLPANKRYRCAYVARQVGVKAKYRLWVTSAERDAITRILSTCPDQPVP
jgi:hypothetical protein